MRAILTDFAKVTVAMHINRLGKALGEPAKPRCIETFWGAEDRSEGKRST